MLYWNPNICQLLYWSFSFFFFFFTYFSPLPLLKAHSFKCLTQTSTTVPCEEHLKIVLVNNCAWIAYLSKDHLAQSLQTMEETSLSLTLCKVTGVSSRSYWVVLTQSTLRLIILYIILVYTSWKYFLSIPYHHIESSSWICNCIYWFLWWGEISFHLKPSSGVLGVPQSSKWRLLKSRMLFTSLRIWIFIILLLYINPLALQLFSEGLIMQWSVAYC